jgi:hypothetical protein
MRIGWLVATAGSAGSGLPRTTQSHAPNRLITTTAPSARWAIGCLVVGSIEPAVADQHGSPNAPLEKAGHIRPLISSLGERLCQFYGLLDSEYCPCLGGGMKEQLNAAVSVSKHE